jgi:hypothetical protein
MRKARAEFLQRLLLIAVAALALTAPAFINGGPFYSSDSIAYIRGPDQAVIKLLGPGHATPWSAKPMGFGFHDGVPPPGAKDQAKPPPMAGRSIYYGLLANLGARVGGFWLTIAVQALAAAMALQLLCRGLGWRRDASYLIVAAIAAFATPLGFFVCCVTPDVWAPILILVAAALVAGGERLSRAELALGFLLLAFAAAAHTTHILLLVAVVGAGVILMILRGRLRFRLGAPGLTAGLALAALIAGAALTAAFNLAVTKVYYAAPLQPPFLTARLIGDGRPGDVWLRAHCPATGFQACAYVGRLPMSTDDFLWSSDPGKSAFWTASPAERTALGNEQFRFAATVLHDDPVSVVRQILADGVSQFVDMSLEDFNHKPSVRASLDSWMVGPDAKVWRASMAYRRAWPVDILNEIELGMFALALAGLVALCIRARAPVAFRPEDERIRVLLAGFVIVAAVAANALICGGLSGIFGRYEARVTAPLILIGLIALSRLGSGTPRGLK